MHRKSHARHVGIDHLLDHHRDVDVEATGLVVEAIDQGPLGKERGPAHADVVDEPLGTDVEPGVELTGPGRGGAVLGGGARADGDRAERHPLMRVDDGGGHVGIDRGSRDRLGGPSRHFRGIFDGQILEHCEQAATEFAVFEKSMPRRGDHDEARRDRRAGRGELAQAGALATGDGGVGGAQFVESADIGRTHASASSSAAMRAWRSASRPS